MRPIDADELKDLICSGCMGGDGSTVCRKDCIDMQYIDTMPTIEAEPVRHGRWINDVYCSECKRFPVDVSVSISNRELTKYFSRCPHCGARMEMNNND